MGKLSKSEQNETDHPRFAVEAEQFKESRNEECRLSVQIVLAKTSPYITNQRNAKQNVSRLPKKVLQVSRHAI